MRASAAVRAEADGEGRTRLTVLRSATPLVLRPTVDALYVAAGAAGPVGGDELDLSVTVTAGACLCVRTVAATVALPGDGVSTFTWQLDVAAGARLCVLPEPTVVVNGARHHTRVVADVAATGSLTVREETQLGRHGETGGTHVTSLRVDVGGAPLLRHELTSAGTDPVSTGASSAIGARAYGSPRRRSLLDGRTTCAPRKSGTRPGRDAARRPRRPRHHPRRRRPPGTPPPRLFTTDWLTVHPPRETA